MSEENPLLTYLLQNDPAFRKPRLAALYSDFSSLRTTNPDGYTANISAWLKGFSHASLAGAFPAQSLLTLSISPSLLQSLESKQWGRPLALGAVVQEGIATKQLVPEKEFMASQQSIYANPWNLNPLNLLGWGLKQLGLIGTVGNTLPRGQVRLVVLANLEEAAKAFDMRTRGARGKGKAERVWTRQAFEKEFDDLISPTASLSRSDWDVLLKFLDRDKEVLVYDKNTVKLRADGETSAITQEDATIANLKTLIRDLEVQVKVLETRVEELAITAKQAVEKKNRVSALAALRSKKLTETTLGKRHATLAQLEEVFVKIEQATDQVELVRIMEASTNVLVGLNKQVGGVERVDNVVDSLREQMGQVDEVGNVLAEQGREGVDETEVDEELEEMEKVEREKREETEKKEREERERKAAEETRKRLDTLEEVGRQARENATAEKEKHQDTSAENALEESMEGLKRMSLDPTEA